MVLTLEDGGCSFLRTKYLSLGQCFLLRTPDGFVRGTNSNQLLLQVLESLILS